MPANPAPVPEKLIPVAIARDFWKANDDGVVIRYRAGTVVEVPVDTALEGVESGALSRIKK